MDLKPVEVFKEVEEYDFTFNAGMSLPVIIDESAGDSLKELPDRFVISLTAKPSLLKPEEMMQPERVTVFKSTLAVLHQRTRHFRLPSPDETFEFQKTLHDLGKSIN